MCTIFTIDQQTYKKMPKAVEKRLMQDFASNYDGASLVVLDPAQPELNTIIRTMSMPNLIGNVTSLMQQVSSNARLFVHMRAATTSDVGVAFTHAFDNMNGVVYMHNGVIDNPKFQYAVDSFRLVEMGQDPDVLFETLLRDRERFANIFYIDTVDYKYSVIRLQSNTLFTDGKGNYSTNACGQINKHVGNLTITHELIRRCIVREYPAASDYSGTTFTDSTGKTYIGEMGQWREYDYEGQEISTGTNYLIDDYAAINNQSDVEYLEELERRKLEESDVSPYEGWDSPDEYATSDVESYREWLKRKVAG